MDPILVPGPPKEAFKKLRPISDLIRSQVNHLKHLEEKLPAAVRATLPQHPLVTEDDAARYIAPMTAYLLSRTAPAPEIPKQPTPVSTAKILPPTPIPPVSAKAGAKKSTAKTKTKRRPSREKK